MCRYQDAALTFSESQLSFEEVALKFLEVNRKDALKIFLMKKLDSLLPSVSGHHTHTPVCNLVGCKFCNKKNYLLTNNLG